MEAQILTVRQKCRDNIHYRRIVMPGFICTGSAEMYRMGSKQKNYTKNIICPNGNRPSDF